MSENPKALLIFIQGNRVDTYINVIAHCFTVEKVNKIYPLVDYELPEEEYKSKDAVNNIKKRIYDLAKKYNEDKIENYKVYSDIKTIICENRKSFDSYINLDFKKPNEILKVISKFKLNKRDVIVDITGCSKRISTDIIVSCIAGEISRVCYFALSDIVFSEDWDKSKGAESKLFHNLITENNAYYGYSNFVKIGTTAKTINKLIKKKYFFNGLLLFLLCFSVLFLIYTFFNNSSRVFLKDFLSVIFMLVSLVLNILNIKDKI